VIHFLKAYLLNSWLLTYWAFTLIQMIQTDTHLRVDQHTVASQRNHDKSSITKKAAILKNSGPFIFLCR